jgi:hypothetical protein
MIMRGDPPGRPQNIGLSALEFGHSSPGGLIEVVRKTDGEEGYQIAA